MLLRQRKTARVDKRGRGQQERLAPAAAQARIAAAFGRRHISVWWCLPAIAAIWMMAGAYYFLLPPEYQSKWSLILPAASNGSTVSLDSIGQTSTAPSQPFGTVTLSPKVIYKEIALSEQVRSAAAAMIGMELKDFGQPRIKLIDETSLMMFQMSGTTPEHAHSKSKALLEAFETQLDLLRRDELEKRADFVRKNLKIYRTNLDRVRAEMLEFQRASGLLSINQYKEAALSAELLRRKLWEVRSERDNLISQQARLTARIGIAPERAAAAIRLASDPAFGGLASVYAQGRAELYAEQRRYGPNHPLLGIQKLKVDSLYARLWQVAEEAGLMSETELKKLLLVANSSNQSDLFKAIVANESALAGRVRQVQSLETELAEIDTQVKTMGKAAARLEALQKDHLVAEAVFTSAAARLDIGRTDLFASYPMVQVLAQPEVPTDRAHPRLSYAIAAGVLGTFFIVLAWGAAWVRSQFGRRR